MATREVLTIPNPILRNKAVEVHEFGEGLQKIINDMIDTMRDEPGVGLAAPQMNVAQRVVVVEFPEDEEDEESPKRLYVVVNPEITRASDEKEIGTEGCLSVPGLIGDVERHLEITIKGKTRRGQLLKLKVNGWTARIFQHEINHLDGILFIDKAVNIRELGVDQKELTV